MVDVIVHWLTVDQVIVSDLGFLDDARNRDERVMHQETPLKDARRAVWAMLCADYAGTVSSTPNWLVRTMAVMMVACHEFEPTESESMTGSMRWCSVPGSTPYSILRRNCRPMVCTDGQACLHCWRCQRRGESFHRNQPPHQRCVGTHPKLRFHILRSTHHPATFDIPAAYSGCGGVYAARKYYTDACAEDVKSFTRTLSGFCRKWLESTGREN